MTERVILVDDDADVRDALSLLLSAAAYPVEALASAEALLEAVAPSDRGCLIVDVRLPGMNGLALQQALRERGIQLPIVFISGHGDIPMAVEAVHAGAMDFLEKPFDDGALIERVDRALALDREQADHDQAVQAIAERVDSLTPREREVMEQILRGKLNKVIASDLDLSTRTVEIHRARVFDKPSARNGPELVRLVLSTPAYRDWLA
jgi:FixJ family two-component response regulator